jgi:hypothetical protein
MKNKDGTARFTVDSAGVATAVSFATTPGNAISGDSITSKVLLTGYHHGDASASLFYVTNYGGTVKAKIDSVGLGTFVGLTTTGAITATSQTIASGAITSSGKSTLDSTIVNGQSWFGAVVDYLSKVSVKNNAVYPYVQSWFNSRGTAIVRFDSVGAITSSAITASGTSAMTKLQVGAGGSGSARVTIDSIIINDSLRIYLSNGKQAVATAW